MLFNSIQYLFFFPVVAVLYFILPYKYRPALLLISSLYFYMAWKPAYLLLILSCIVISYLTARLVEQCTDTKKRRLFMVLGIILNLSILFTFKYLDFLNGLIGKFVSLLGLSYGVPDFSILLPMGISFYTFQSLSYVIDVYRGNTKAEKSFFIYALYISFFPQLVAGPIERSYRLLPQLREKHDFNPTLAADGLKFIAWGLFKKLVIADRISPAVDKVYSSPESFGGIALAAATVLFAVQIYCDFSGYSDIAIGSAQFMGIRLMKNFRQPYFSASIREFWKRWHISLSEWFRDYLYIPLGGNRCSKPRQCFNLMVTFLASGLWHGANLTFVVWGCLHGAYQIIGNLTGDLRKKIRMVTGLEEHRKLHKAISVLTVFSLTCFAWIFFRAQSVSQAFTVISGFFSGSGKNGELSVLFPDGSDVIILIASCTALFIVDYLSRRKSLVETLKTKPLVIRWGCYLALVAAVLCLNYAETSSFIYFQF